jgi:hypothetical protein
MFQNLTNSSQFTGVLAADSSKRARTKHNSVIKTTDLVPIAVEIVLR